MKNEANLNAIEETAHNTPLHLAMAAGDSYSHYLIADLLLFHGASVNEENINGDEPLHVFAQTKMTDLVQRIATMELLINYGAALNNENDDGKTALDYSTHDKGES